MAQLITPFSFVLFDGLANDAVIILLTPDKKLKKIITEIS